MFGAPRIAQEEIREVVDTLRSGWIGTGPKVKRFEAAFRAYTGVRHAVAVSSGSAALHLAMLAVGIGQGDEVITTPLTFGATANAILHTGAIPRFVDVDRATQNLDPDLVPRALTRRTRALLPVHLAGRPCEMAPLLALARRRRLLVVEDAAHAIEAVYRGRRAGTLGHLGCFSFYVTKNITTAEGGMVVTRSRRLADLIKMYALHGMTQDAWFRFSDRVHRHYRIVVPGFKYNLIDLHAAIGIHQLKAIERWWRRRRTVWEYYTERFRDLPVRLPDAHVPGGRHALHLFTVHLDLERIRLSRDEVQEALNQRGIGSGVHFISLHLHPYYRKRFSFKPGDYPNALWVSERTLSLPFSAKLTDAEVERVVEAFRTVMVRAVRRRGTCRVSGGSRCMSRGSRHTTSAAL